MNLDKSDADRGLYAKFKVTRSDGSSRKGRRHEGCSYYVLDLDHDPYSIAALLTYSDACAETFPALSDDIKRKVEQITPGLQNLLRAQLQEAGMNVDFGLAPLEDIEVEVEDTTQLESNERGPRPNTMILSLVEAALVSLEAGTQQDVKTCLEQIRDIAADADARTGTMEKNLDA